MLTNLNLEGINVIRVDVSISKGVDEFTNFQVADVRNHVGEKRIAGNVKWYTQALLPLNGESQHSCTMSAERW